MSDFSSTLPTSELDLPLCVSSGQVFRWKKLKDGTWLGVDGPHWFHVEISEKGCESEYRVCSNAASSDFERLFRLESRLGEIEGEILSRGPELAPYVAQLSGLRVLRPSDPYEVLLCFLCTPNNNLERITRMVRALSEYGEAIDEVNGEVFRRFPCLERIAAIPESELRGKMFGYRGASIPNVAKQLLLRPPEWLSSLMGCSYAEAHVALCEIKGIGPKLADCICLFGLHHLEAVPVDTHLWQAARRLYFPEMDGKSLTDARYKVIGNHFRKRFGKLAGWAHQYLFYENLMRWRSRSVQDRKRL